MTEHNREAVATQGATPQPYGWLAHYPANVRWDAVIKPEPLFTLLDRAVANHGARPCTNFLGRVNTYKDIGALVDRVAAGLQSLGVTKGTKVGLFLPNCPTFVIYYYAILKAGGTVVNFNPLYTLEELAYQLKDSDTEIMVTLDLKVLFDKVDALLQSGALPRAVVASFPALLPSAKSVLFKLFKGKELSRPQDSKAAGKIVLEGQLMSRSAKL
ncbi:MAG: dicarboxylate--CoA ligase PimA, partial [Planctomycetaceae bacterium]|nr:dicarboxylate--CoA ligase PimA [Planctomycetaceae bacterium]